MSENDVSIVPISKKIDRVGDNSFVPQDNEAASSNIYTDRLAEKVVRANELVAKINGADSLAGVSKINGGELEEYHNLVEMQNNQENGEMVRKTAKEDAEEKKKILVDRYGKFGFDRVTEAYNQKRSELEVVEAERAQKQFREEVGDIRDEGDKWNIDDQADVETYKETQEREEREAALNAYMENYNKRRKEMEEAEARVKGEGETLTIPEPPPIEELPDPVPNGHDLEEQPEIDPIVAAEEERIRKMMEGFEEQPEIPAEPEQPELIEIPDPQEEPTEPDENHLEAEENPEEEQNNKPRVWERLKNWVKKLGEGHEASEPKKKERKWMKSNFLTRILFRNDEDLNRALGFYEGITPEEARRIKEKAEAGSEIAAVDAAEELKNNVDKQVNNLQELKAKFTQNIRVRERTISRILFNKKEN